MHRTEGRQHKESAATLAETRPIKQARQADARERRRGPSLQRFSLAWLDRYAGSGHDVVREATRREYRRLLINFALTYVDRYLTRAELVSLLDEMPDKWRSLFELLAATGLRISEALGLRWSDLRWPAASRICGCGARSLRAPKSRHGARLIPLTPALRRAGGSPVQWRRR